VRLLTIPRPLLYAGILVVSTLGAWSVHRAPGDLLLLAAVGTLGFVLRRLDCPIAPVMIGLILGPLAEQQLRRALAISEGDWSVFVTRPLSLTLLIVAALVILAPLVVARRRSAAIPAR
jgi:putative tricarboxylic transport membrane protein